MMHYREPASIDPGVSQSSPCRSSTPRRNVFYDPGDPDEIDTGMRNIVYENDRVRNDLLDEICKDIGLKDSIDLDFLDISSSTGQHQQQQQQQQSCQSRSTNNNNGVHKDDDLDEIIPFGVNDCHEPDSYHTPINRKMLHKQNHEYSPYARPQNLLSQIPPSPDVKFIQRLICDDTPAFRSHPLFPLLRDLVLADMNFALPSFPRQLIANLPADFERLLRNFVMRNRTSETGGNASVDNVLMQCLRSAHHSLINKIQMVRSQPQCQVPLMPQQQQQQQQHHQVHQGPPTPQQQQQQMQQQMQQLTTMPQQCGSVQTPISQQGSICQQAPPPQCQIALPSPISPCHGGLPPAHYPDGSYGNQPPQPPPQMLQMPGSPSMHHSPQLPPGSPSMHMPMPMPGSPMHHRNRYDQYMYHSPGMEYALSSELQPKQPGKKATLPKESVATMLDWLRDHQDNPYPNDDEKEMLINKTKLSINQINYWFTNARRRILPKWNSQKKEENLKQEDKKVLATTIN